MKNVSYIGPKPKRKIIQISSCFDTEANSSVLIALCDDGSLWSKFQSEPGNVGEFQLVCTLVKKSSDTTEGSVETIDFL